MICVGDKEVERVERASRSDSCGLFCLLIFQRWKCLRCTHMLLERS